MPSPSHDQPHDQHDHHDEQHGAETDVHGPGVPTLRPTSPDPDLQRDLTAMVYVALIALIVFIVGMLWVLLTT